MKPIHSIGLLFLALLFLNPGISCAQETDLDRRVRAFLEAKKGEWRDLNIPASDGQLIFDLIVEKGYTRALEIGTSTGHSAIWIAWALSKTGGKLITVEIDPARREKALSNFREAGLLDYIDSRLANAHELVPQLQGPFDFVFSDADKGWYVNYFKAVDPNLISGGCFAAHNVRPPGRRTMSGTREYRDYVTGLENYQTRFDNSGGGLAISIKN